MSKLKENLAKLLEFAKEHSFFESFSQVHFVEEKSIRFVVETGSQKISREILFSFENYESRFNELLNQGHSWIHLHLAGCLEDSILVTVRTSDYRNTAPPEAVSINLSLPEKSVVKNDWKLSPFYEITD